MKQFRALSILMVLVGVLVLMTLQTPGIALSSSPLGIKPTDEIPKIPGVEPRDGSDDVSLPGTGDGSVGGLNNEAAIWPVSEPGTVKGISLPSNLPTDNTSVVRVIIPSIHLDSLVKNAPFSGKTWDVDGLGMNVGWLEKTSLPGLGGNTVLAGHLTLDNTSIGPFRYLLYLQPGAEIRVYTQKSIYLYQVDFQIRAETKDAAIVKNTSEPRLTLITCSQWDRNAKEYKARRAVVAVLKEVRSYHQ
jgi:LPXTG-site transpeptidase (sortase) family protein